MRSVVLAAPYHFVSGGVVVDPEYMRILTFRSLNNLHGKEWPSGPGK